MGIPIQQIMAIEIADLTTNLAAAKYPLGTVLAFDDGSGVIAKYMYVKDGAVGMSANGVYVIDKDYKTAVPLTNAVGAIFGVCETAFTSGYYGWVKIEGNTLIYSAGNTTATHTGKMANSVATVTDEAGAAETAKTIGVINTTSVPAVNCSVTLLNKRVTI